MGLETLAMAAIIGGSLASVGTSVASAVRKPPKAALADEAAAKREAARKQAEQERARRGRSSTLMTPGGGLGESPTLGRPSLLGA